MLSRTEWAVLAVAAAWVAGVLLLVDLSPRVESEFFFSEEDPQLRATVEIAARFPSPDQLVIRVGSAGSPSEAYQTIVGELAEGLRELAGVAAVYSIVTEDPRSPLWGRLLLNPDSAATNVIVQVDDTDPAVLVRGVEDVVARFRTAAVTIQTSGVPYVVELIRRNLFRDFVLFSSAALLVFGVVIWIVYRRGRVVIGTLASCLLACAVTLAVTDVLGISIGLLTANIVTIVFVLTLSHIVFFTSNWTRLGARADQAARDGVREAARVTFEASLWCAVTTLLGFLSLLLASARPLRELGLAGAIGTVVALAVAFTAYPVFLRGATTPDSGRRRTAENGGGWQATVAVGRFLPSRRRWAWLIGVAVVVLALAPGVWRVQTDPSLLSYFAQGSPLREGLETIDRDGGSSILYLVVRDAGGEQIDTDEANEAMWVLQDALEADSAVGVVLSPAVLLAHAKRQPLAGFLSLSALLSILEQPVFGGIARSFVTAGRDQGLFFLRMRESRREGSRTEVVSRMTDLARQSGLEVVTTGGVYELQDQLGRLIARSLRFGLGGLLVLFIGVALVVSRSLPLSAAMVGCLTAIPVAVLGVMGYVRLPVDIITSPAANVALAMGVDSMIHLVTRTRRLRADGLRGWAVWQMARGQLAPPIVGAALIICAGFGIFGLSAFPPTQRFGIAVILGTVTAATMALVALPFTATRPPYHPTPTPGRSRRPDA